MKIAILSRSSALYSTRRLKEAAEARGHEAQVIDYMQCYMNITASKPQVQYQKQTLKAFDAVIPRISPQRTFYGTAIVRQFETRGTFCINPSIAITRSRDKLRSLQLLAMKDVDMPRTGFAHSPREVDELINLVGGPPLIIKVIEGTQGVGVLLAETKKAAESMVQAFMGLNANIIVQEFINESAGSDIRCLVIGNKVVASMCRQASPGEFRSNIHRGGSATPIRITADERKAAINAVKILGLRMAGVDLLRSKRGPLILEVNSSPGLEGIETATGKDIATMAIEFIEKTAANKNSRYEG